MQSALSDVKVLDLTHYVAGPYCTKLLSDYGADVLKIEKPHTGDGARNAGPFHNDNPHIEKSGLFLHLNTNKKSITLNLKTTTGIKIFKELVKDVDILVENFSPRVMPELGLDYATLSRVNPRIIHANVSGYGPEGPMRDLGAFDPLGLARSGMMFVTGTREPVLMHLGILDQATAIATSHAILTALFVRERNGIGQEVHVSLYSTGQWLMQPSLMINNILSAEPMVRGDRSEQSPLRNFFHCKDGKWIIGTHHPEEKYWPVFCEATGLPDLIEDPRFADDEARANNCAELVGRFDKVFSTKTRDEWMDIFLSKGLMFCSIQHVSEIKNDPQAIANKYVVDFEDPAMGKLNLPGYPVHFSANRAGTRKLAPGLGEHTVAVLEEIGYTDQEIDELRKQGVIR